MDTVLQWGVGFIRAIQQALPGLDGAMSVASSFGLLAFAIPFVAMIYWCVDTAMAARLALLLIASDQLNAWVKWLAHGPRPYWLDPTVGRATESSFGVPSGHSQGAAVLWLYLAASVRRAWAWPAAAAVVLLISFSRMYLGVHFPHDVLVGWILAGLCLFVGIRLLPGMQARAAAWPAWAVPAAAFGTAGAMAGISAALHAWVAGVPDSPEWVLLAAKARDASSCASLAGMMAGALLGFGLQERLVRFHAAGPAWKRGARFLVGAVGIVAVLAGLGAVLPRTPGLARYTLLGGGYFSLLLWASYVAPWIFVRAGLARARGKGVGVTV